MGNDLSKSARLDLALVALGLASTRSQARDLVLRGEVSVAGQRATRPAMKVPPGASVAVTPGAAGLVSRGALKLRAALDAFGFEPDGRVALDVGASTGGFTQVLIERGAQRVYAVDVGHGQLDARLATDPRVVSLEGCDARRLDRAMVPGPVRAIVADVSFVSVTKVLAPALALAAADCWLVVLVKPQFEAGRAAVSSGGIVRDPADRLRALAGVRDWIEAQEGWRVAGTVPSPIAGGSGNEEHLIGARRHD